MRGRLTSAVNRWPAWAARDPTLPRCCGCCSCTAAWRRPPPWRCRTWITGTSRRGILHSRPYCWLAMLYLATQTIICFQRSDRRSRIRHRYWCDEARVVRCTRTDAYIVLCNCELVAAHVISTRLPHASSATAVANTPGGVLHRSTSESGSAAAQSGFRTPCSRRCAAHWRQHSRARRRCSGQPSGS